MTIKQQIKDDMAELRDYILLLEDERDYLDARCAEYENFARDFIETEYHNVLCERLEKILYNEKDTK